MSEKYFWKVWVHCASFYMKGWVERRNLPTVARFGPIAHWALHIAHCTLLVGTSSKRFERAPEHLVQLNRFIQQRIDLETKMSNEQCPMSNEQSA
jgi:hypothetical protein